MKRIISIASICLCGVACSANDMVRATLEPSTNRAGVFTIHVTNVSSNAIRFLDIREGTGWCGEFYEVTIEKDGKKHKSEGNCLYAPGDEPFIVALAPGKTYQRDIQPVAYARSEKHMVPPCDVTVTYRVTSKIKEMWRARATEVDLDLSFETNKARIETSNKGVQATR
jgi:hypothetical protein